MVTMWLEEAEPQLRLTPVYSEARVLSAQRGLGTEQSRMDSDMSSGGSPAILGCCP